jgi:hypothetical protein
MRNGAEEFWSDFVWGVGPFWTNLKWMIFTTLAAEFILGKAIGDFVAVWNLQQEMEQYVTEYTVEWGLGYGFFALMGVLGLSPSNKPSTKQNNYSLLLVHEGSGTREK